jgi:hypothetical protein
MTGGGNGNQHRLTLGGNLTNNGVLDFSTNNNMAAASITFTGASNNTFGGSGPVTDISWITIEKGTPRANILELSVSNGGDLTIDNTLALTHGVIFAGSNRIILNGNVTRIDGTLVKRITATGTYNFWIGRNVSSPVRATVNALGTSPSFLSVTAVDTTLPGLVPRSRFRATGSWRKRGT